MLTVVKNRVTIKNLYGEDFQKKYGHKCPLGVNGRNSNNKLFFEKLGWKVSKPLISGLIETYNWIDIQVKKVKK